MRRCLIDRPLQPGPAPASWGVLTAQCKAHLNSADAHAIAAEGAVACAVGASRLVQKECHATRGARDLCSVVGVRLAHGACQLVGRRHPDNCRGADAAAAKGAGWHSTPSWKRQVTPHAPMHARLPSPSSVCCGWWRPQTRAPQEGAGQCRSAPPQPHRTNQPPAPQVPPRPRLQHLCRGRVRGAALGNHAAIRSIQVEALPGTSRPEHNTSASTGGLPAACATGSAPQQRCTSTYRLVGTPGRH